MLLIEYRIKLPISIDQYQIAHLYTTMDVSKQYTKLGDGVEVLENTPCDPARLPHQKPGARKEVGKVQRTSKRYYVPDSIAAVVGLNQVVLRESSFNKFPTFRTTVSAESAADSAINGEFTIDTVCRKGDDVVNKDNVFRLPQELLDRRAVVDIDIVADSLPASLVNDDEDPKKALGLADGWQGSLIPGMSMIVYKLVFVKIRDPANEVFKETINSLVMDNLNKIFNVFHRKLVCSQDRWKGLNMEDIRTMEEETKDLLDKKREGE
jgi:hypothetical protein